MSAAEARSNALRSIEYADLPVPTVPRIRSVSLPVSEPRFTVRVYYPAIIDRLDIAVVNCHGGGWVTGDVESHQFWAASHANNAQCILIDVDYRLAPEFPYPAAVDDICDAIAWALEQFSEVIVLGTSAGANLATAAVLRALGASRQPKALILQLPAFDARSDRSLYPSRSEYDHPYLLLTHSAMQHYLEQYIPPKVHRDDPLLSPVLSARLGMLPKCHICAAKFDVLADEAAEFVDRMQTQNGEVNLKILPTAAHFSGAFPVETASGRELTSWVAETIRSACIN